MPVPTAMATLTIRNVPEEVIARVKAAATRSGRSMEEELRRLLQERYPDRRAVVDAIRARWKDLPAVSAAEVDGWIEATRGRPVA